MSDTSTHGARSLMDEVEQHLPLVAHIVYQVAVHFPRHVDRDELVQAGVLGLVEAVQRFDPARGVPFERFAGQRIRGSILDAVRSADWAPRSLRTTARKLDSTRQVLANRLGRSPTTGEVAQALGISTTRLADLEQRISRSVILALDEFVAVTDQNEITLADLLPSPGDSEPGDVIESRELHAYLRDAVATLPERHRLVIVGYFLEGRASLDLARFLNVTESRISQLRSEALAMLRDGITAQYDGHVRDDAAPKGRVARRKSCYAKAIAARHTWQDRLTRVGPDETAVRSRELLGTWA